ncbi:hypothetical protein ACFL6B_06950 [Thermodesulfobacteriota bacterium]
MSEDPKPTRYTAFVYSIYVSSVMGYIFIGRFIREKVRAGYSSYIVNIFLCFLAIFLGLRLHKNYNDMQSYRQEYAKELKITYIHDIIDKANTEHKDADIYLLFDKKMQVKQFMAHPSIGLFVLYRFPANIKWFLKTDYTAKKLLPPCVIYSWNNEASRFEIEVKNAKEEHSTRPGTIFGRLWPHA